MSRYFSILLLASCATPLAPADELTSVRVLALRAEPTSLAPDGSVALDALVYVPGNDTPTYSWSWCPSLGTASDNFACLVTASALQTALDPDGSLGITIDFSLGTNATATFVYPATLAALQTLCQPLPGSASSGASSGSSAGTSSGSSSSAGSTSGSAAAPVRLDCSAGAVPISIVLTVTVGAEQIRAYRSLDLLFAADTSGNTNPTLGDFSFAANNMSTTALTSGTTYTITNAIPASATDTFTATLGGPTGVPTSELEGLALSWFVSAGTLGSATTALAPGAAPDTRSYTSAETNTWVAPKVLSASTVELVLVARDTRGGVGWTTQTVTVASGEEE